MEEKRRYPRVGTVNLISYIAVDRYGNQQSQGMGNALDISKKGIGCCPGQLGCGRRQRMRYWSKFRFCFHLESNSFMGKK